MTNQKPSFREALVVWAKIGLVSFGGPAGQIALMHRVLVEEKKWIDESRFLHALNFCMLLPGPEAQQLATYIGWLLHGTRGGVAAGLLFILPGAFVILVLSFLYVHYADLSLVEGAFLGVKAAVVAIVVEAVIRISKRALKSRALYMIAGAAFVAIFMFAAPFPAVVAAAAMIGVIGARFWPASFSSRSPSDANSIISAAPAAASAFRAAALFLVLWLGPLALLIVTLGPDHVFTKEAVFFSKMAVVTFGGAYAVLAYVAQQAVEAYQWLAPGEMVDGLGLAETTPGPLVLVLQFVGFLAGFRADTGAPPLVSGLIGAGIATWMTFTPCFLWVFLGAPFIEKLRGARLFNAALTAITAAVVGVVLNLAVWFSVHVLFREVRDVSAGPLRLALPEPGSLDVIALALAVGAAILILRLKIAVPTALALAAIAGLAAAGVS